MKVKLLLEIFKLFTSLSLRVDKLEEIVEDNNDGDGSLRERIEQLEEFMANIKDQITELVNKVSELQSTLSDEVTELRTAIEALFARIRDLEGLDIGPQIEAVNAAIAGIEALSDLTVEPDTQIPTTPGSLTASNVTATSADLSYSASTDNVGVNKYEIFSGSDKFGESMNTSFTASGLTPETTFVFSVRAVDKAGNFSAMSDPVTVVTLAV